MRSSMFLSQSFEPKQNPDGKIWLLSSRNLKSKKKELALSKVQNFFNTAVEFFTQLVMASPLCKAALPSREMTAPSSLASSTNLLSLSLNPASK